MDISNKTRMTNETSLEKQRREDSHRIIKRFLMYSSSVGLLPIPTLDILALPAFQVAMVRELARLYEVPFSEQTGKALIAALISVGSKASTMRVTVSFLKTIPLLGQASSFLAGSLLDGATTYAVGIVFIQHFETGGTLLNFDPEAMKAHYASILAEIKADSGVLRYAGVKP